MKKAIVILSLLLAIAAGWIVWTQVHKDPALEAALQYNAAALSGTRMVEASNARQAELIDHQAGALSRADTQIAALKKANQEEQQIAHVAVEQGADFAAAFASGAPIVEQAEIPALTDWYKATGGKLPPFLATVAGFEDLAAARGVRIQELEGTIGDIRKDNVALKAENTLDKATIADLEDDLRNERQKVTDAQNAGRLPETILKLGIAAAIVYFGGNALGVW